MQIENAAIIVKFQIDIDQPEIAAHFPSQPILAAYKQINFLESIYQDRLIGVADVKFKSQITPPCEIEIILNNNTFEIKVAGQVKTTGKLILK